MALSSSTATEVWQLKNAEYIRIIHVNKIRHLHVVNPRHACAARVTVVVLCVCLSTTILALQATI